MSEIEEIKDWFSVNSDRLPYDARKYFQTLLSSLEKKEERVKEYKKLLHRCGMILGKGEDHPEDIPSHVKEMMEKVKKLDADLYESVEANIGWSNSYAELLDRLNKLKEAVERHKRPHSIYTHNDEDLYKVLEEVKEAK